MVVSRVQKKCLIFHETLKATWKQIFQLYYYTAIAYAYAPYAVGYHSFIIFYCLVLFQVYLICKTDLRRWLYINKYHLPISYYVHLGEMCAPLKMSFKGSQGAQTCFFCFPFAPPVLVENMLSCYWPLTSCVALKKPLCWFRLLTAVLRCLVPQAQLLPHIY